MQVIEAQCPRPWRLTITLHIKQIRSAAGAPSDAICVLDQSMVEES
jgi:hypothetical protein